LHFRGDLPELTVEEFIKEYPNFDDYSWVHFEGRNFKETPKMIEHIRKHRNPNATTISLELEKIREYAWYEKFIHLVDLLFMSKDLAKHLGS
jgi:sugar/nucleoside kinase (ribokinase family)